MTTIARVTGPVLKRSASRGLCLNDEILFSMYPGSIADSLPQRPDGAFETGTGI